MPKVCRNYQHEDFSHLIQKKSGQRRKEQHPDFVPFSTGIEHRQQLMNNPRMKYIISKRTGRIHDRDCPKAASIDDAAFDMLTDFPAGPIYPRPETFCPKCYRRALIRKGLEISQSQHIDSIYRALSDVDVSNLDLYRLFVENKARIYHFEPNRLFMQVRNELWCAERKGDLFLLYHNNYSIGNNQQRLRNRDRFHLQITYPVPFKDVISSVSHYKWDISHNQASSHQK